MANSKKLVPDIPRKTAESGRFPELDLEVVGTGDAERICAVAYVLGEVDAVCFEACFDWNYASSIVTTTTSIARDAFGEDIWRRAIALLYGVDAGCVAALPLLRSGYFQRASVRIYDDLGNEGDRRWLATVRVHNGRFLLEQADGASISESLSIKDAGADAGQALRAAVFASLRHLPAGNP